MNDNRYCLNSMNYLYAVMFCLRVCFAITTQWHGALSSTQCDGYTMRRLHNATATQRDGFAFSWFVGVKSYFINFYLFTFNCSNFKQSKVLLIKILVFVLVGYFLSFSACSVFLQVVSGDFLLNLCYNINWLFYKQKIPGTPGKVSMVNSYRFKYLGLYAF